MITSSAIRLTEVLSETPKIGLLWNKTLHFSAVAAHSWPCWWWVALIHSHTQGSEQILVPLFPGHGLQHLCLERPSHWEERSGKERAGQTDSTNSGALTVYWKQLTVLATYGYRCKGFWEASPHLATEPACSVSQGELGFPPQLNVSHILETMGRAKSPAPWAELNPPAPSHTGPLLQRSPTWTATSEHPVKTHL